MSLDGFFPGMKSLLGEVEHAMRIHLNYYNVWRQFSGWPEFYHVDKKLPIQGRDGKNLRILFLK
jgi:mannosidase alpha-like ER degradation enhancer 1